MEKDKTKINPTRLFEQYEYIKMNALENRLFALLMRWEITRKWWQVGNNIKKSIQDFLSRFYSTLTSCMFVGMLIYTTQELTPATVILMDKCLDVSRRILRNYKSLKEDISEFWQTPKMVKLYLEIEEREISQVECQISNRENAIEIQKGQFYWPQVIDTVTKPKRISDILLRTEEEVKTSFVLEDFEFTAKKGELTVLIGKVASGKSSVIQAVLREMPLYISTSEIKNSGMKFSQDGSISYVGQKPFIFTSSVKDNILTGKVQDEKKFEFALKYSCLDKDVKLWENGLDHHVTDSGMNISGGQKSRLAFARALYSDSDILVLDDLTSALDPPTTDFILRETIGRVLKGKTIIMSTNDMSVLKYADQIYYIEEGKILHQGKFESIKTSELWQKQKEMLDEFNQKKDQCESKEASVEDDASDNGEKVSSDEDQEGSDSEASSLESESERSSLCKVKSNSEAKVANNSRIKPFVIFGNDFGLIVYFIKDLGGWRNSICVVISMVIDNIIHNYSKNYMMSWSEVFQKKEWLRQFLTYFGVQLIIPVVYELTGYIQSDQQEAANDNLYAKMQYKMYHAPLEKFLDKLKRDKISFYIEDISRNIT